MAAALGAALPVLTGLSCSEARYAAEPGRAHYQPDRRDYAAFRAAYPGLLEPNYLPFMVHRFGAEDPRGDLMVLCRWPDSAMPIPVVIEAPVIPDDLQDEFHPILPSTYVDRVMAALETWEEGMEGLVRFDRRESVAESGEALHIRIHGEQAPAPTEEIQVLGHTNALRRACRIVGEDPDADRVKLAFHVPELVLYVADRTGMLTPNQVERVALHEIGHALGMMGHSPIPTDFMFSIVRDRPNTASLSTEDLNSFISLYRLPEGTIFARVPSDGAAERLPPRPPSGRPNLALAPHVDARHGYELRVPDGWHRVETPRGFFASNGPIWDRDASLEIVVWPYPTIESFLNRFERSLFANTWLRERSSWVLAGRRALQVVVEDERGEREEEFLFVELGDGRVMMLLGDYPLAYGEEWRPWLHDMLATLEVWPEPGDRDWPGPETLGPVDERPGPQP